MFKQLRDDEIKLIELLAEEKDLESINRILNARINAKVRETLPITLDIAKSGYQMGNKDIGIQTVTPDNVIIAETRPNVEHWLRANARGRIDNRAAAIHKRIAELDQEGIKNKIGVKKMASMLLAEGLVENRVAAMRMARTNSIWAVNEGSVRAWMKQGIAYKEWLVTDGDATCDICRGMSGKVTRIEGSFVRKGESFSVYNDETDKHSTFTSNNTNIHHPPLHPNCRCSMLPLTEWEYEEYEEEPTPAPPQSKPEEPKPAPVEITIEPEKAEEPKKEYPKFWSAKELREYLVNGDEFIPADIRKMFVETDSLADAPLLQEKIDKMDQTGKYQERIKEIMSWIPRERLTDEEQEDFAKLRIVEKNQKRGEYLNEKRTVVISNRKNIEEQIDDSVHELGHHISEYAKILENQNVYYGERTENNPVEHLPGYDKDVVGKKDDFGPTDYYAGRFYKDNPPNYQNPEMFCVGLELLYRDPRGFAESDAEYFDFIISQIKGIPTGR